MTNANLPNANQVAGQPVTLRQIAIPLLLRRRWQLAIVGLLIPISASCALAVPYLTKLAIDHDIVPAAAARDLAPYASHLYTLVAMAIGIVVLGYISDALYVSILQRVGQGLIADLRTQVYRRTLRLPRSYFDAHPIGTLLTRVTSDIEALGESLASGVLSLFLDFLKVTGYLVVMFLMEWRLTLVVLVLIPVMALLIRFFNSRIRATFLGTRHALSEATGYLQECLSGMKTLQLFAAEHQAIETFKQKNRKFFDAQNASNFYDALMFSLVEGITTLALALLLWYSAGELLAGILTLGVLVAFMEYIQRLFVPVREFSQQVATIQRAMAALDHIGELISTPLDPAEADARNRVAEAPMPGRLAFQSLEFHDVRFRYQANGPEILKGVSFRLQKGETLAVVGATGSGKSTLIKLITRAYSGYEGSILLNGRELREYPAETLGSLISVVHQGVFLYQGTVGFNIGLGRVGVDRAVVERAAQYVSADEFITRLEGGYDFAIAPGGANLSAGQCQLISFARAVAAETEVIVLDEATSSVDSLTEHLIQQAVGRLYEDKTVIAIAHRLSTIRNAHTILVMDNGQIAESGTHDQLLAKGGLYADLVGQLEQEQSTPLPTAAESRPGAA